MKYRADLEYLNSGFYWKSDDLVKECDSRICSYHMKNILMWSSKEPDTCKEPCPFILMIRLLYKLESCLTCGSLPHYFNVENNLLENVSINDLALTRTCIVEMLRDPVTAMSSIAVQYSCLNEAYVH